MIKQIISIFHIKSEKLILCNFEQWLTSMVNKNIFNSLQFQ